VFFRSAPIMGRLKTTQKDRISCVLANPLLLAHVGAEALKKAAASVAGDLVKF
jgi:hypothetical protein